MLAGIILCYIRKLVFEYNITERTLEFRNRGAYSSDLPALVSDLPEKLIEDGTVCPGSVPVWRRIFDQLHKGGDFRAGRCCGGSDGYFPGYW